jgi:hypothetical protein
MTGRHRREGHLLRRTPMGSPGAAAWGSGRPLIGPDQPARQGP